LDKLKAMKCFCRVVEAGSYAAAAQSLDTVPSALSKLVTALEQELGFCLLNRSTRRLSPTDDGAAYYERCREIMLDIEEAESPGRSGRVQARGTLRVGMHPSLRFEMLTRLGAFLDGQPELKIETVITNTPTAVVGEGLDMVLHVGRLSDSSLVARQIGWTRSLVCASTGYLAARGEPRHPEDLARHHAVIYARRDEDANSRWTFDRDGERCEVDVAARTVVRDGIGVIDAVLGSCGVARPFELAARHWLATGQLREVLVDWAGERQAIHAVFPSHGGMRASKVKLYTAYVVGLLDAAT
jgi:LysR family transcriptional regulator, regulator for bpeEF and oprC